MHPYRFSDGRVMYYPTRLGDIEEQEERKISVSDLLQKSGYRKDETNPDESLIDVEGTVVSPKQIDFTAHSLMVYEYVKKKTGYTGNLSMFVNEAITLFWCSGEKAWKVGVREEELYEPQ